MLVVADPRALDMLAAGPLRQLVYRRTDEIANDADGEWIGFVRFIVVEPTDSTAAIDAELGFPVLERPFEFIEEHPTLYEIVFVLSDDGAGVEVFVPKHPEIDNRLTALCEAHALPLENKDPS